MTTDIQHVQTVLLVPEIEAMKKKTGIDNTKDALRFIVLKYLKE